MATNDLREIFVRPLVLRSSSGKEYRTAPLDFTDHAALQDFLDRQQQSAVDVAHEEIAKGRLVKADNGQMVRQPYPMDMQRWLLDRALTLDSMRRVELGSPEAERILDGYLGTIERIRMTLRKGTPGITEAEIEQLLNELNEADRSRVAAAAEVLPAGHPKPGKGNGFPASTPTTANASSTGNASSGA